MIDAEVSKAAEIVYGNHIHHLVVINTSDGTLAGIVSSFALTSLRKFTVTKNCGIFSDKYLRVMLVDSHSVLDALTCSFFMKNWLRVGVLFFYQVLVGMAVVVCDDIYL